MKKPTPLTASEIDRWEEVTLRRRILSGDWYNDAKSELIRNFANKYQVYGEPVCTYNLLKRVCEETSGLYAESPKIGNSQSDVATLAMIDILDSVKFAPLMNNVQYNAIGLREMLLRVDAYLEANQVVIKLHMVYPDEVVCVADPRDPSRPIEVAELQRLRNPNDASKSEYYWIKHSLSGDVPVKSISDSNGIDVSDMFGLPVGGLAGEQYPYFDMNGRPFIPYVLYHAAITGKLFDYKKGSELIKATLHLAVLNTFYSHSVKSNSWPQRYILNANIASASYDDDKQESVVVGDPATIVRFVTESEGGQPIAGQFQAGSPKDIIESIENYERMVISSASMDKASVVRTQADIRSAASLAIEYETKRIAKRHYAQIFKAFDIELLSLISKMYNVAAGAILMPETGWQIEYIEPDRTSEDKVKERQAIKELVEMGLMSKVEARMKLMNETKEEAQKAIAEIERGIYSIGGTNG